MRSMTVDIIKQTFSNQAGTRLHRRLYSSISHCIISGILKPSTRLPPSRDLADELALSRNTVLRVYDQLMAEGYIVSRASSGTFVTDCVIDKFLNSSVANSTCAALNEKPNLSKRCNILLGNSNINTKQWGTFIPGVPDLQSFPHKLFNKIQSRIVKSPANAHLAYDVEGGFPALKHALTDYLSTSRGVNCTPAQIIITDGIHQALDLITRTLCDAGDAAWVEEPGYWGVRNILQVNEVNIIPVPVDEEGLIPLAHPAVIPKLIFVTPSHQYPLGPVMSMARRQQLLAFSRLQGSWIIEDDYDSEFRFSGSPVPSLQGMDENDRVIYVGTFSKTIYPSLRLGYLILPKSLSSPLKKIYNELYRGGHLITQAALAEFISEGFYSAHIRKMRQLYARRRAFLQSLIETYLGPHALSHYNSNAGLHLILALPQDIDDVAIADAANSAGILVRPLSKYYITATRLKGLLISFSNLPERGMEREFKLLLEHIPDVLKK